MFKISRFFLPLLLLVYIGVETYLKLHHTSLCDATGCKLAGDLLRFDPMYLYYFGAAGAALLLLFGLLSLYDGRYISFYRALLLGALSFETVIFAYQVAVNPEPCIFCMGVLGTLLVTALFEMQGSRLIPLFMVFAGISAMMILATVKNTPIFLQDGRFLFFSPVCPHCHKVKDYLKEHNITYTPININDASARRVVHALGIDKIPVWIEKESHKYKMIVGDANIIAYMDTEKKIYSTDRSTANTLINENDLENLLGNGGSNDEGCAISITPEPSCVEKRE